MSQVEKQIPKYLDWAGHFYGNDLDLEHYEILTIQYIPKKERKLETQLMTTKWFDYRLMHPMQATYYFFRLFKNEYRNFYRKAIDHKAAEFVKPIKERDFLLSREALSFWRLRQAIDALGMRYDFYLKTAFDKCFKVIANGRPLPPRPAQLKKEELLIEVFHGWESYCQASLQIAKSPYFTATLFHNSPMQVDYEDFIVKQVRMRQVQHYALGTCIYRYDALRIEKALESFDISIINQAIKSSI